MRAANKLAVLAVMGLGLFLWQGGYCDKAGPKAPKKATTEAAAAPALRALEPAGKPIKEVAKAWKTSQTETAPTFTLAVTDRAALLTPPDAEQALNLLPTLLVAHRPMQAAPRTNKGMPPAKSFTFRRATLTGASGETWNLRASVSTGGARFKLHLWSSPGDPRIVGDVTVTYLKDVLVHQETLAFGPWAAPSAAMLDRGYVVRKVTKPSFSGSLTPHLAFVGRGDQGVTLKGGRGFMGMWTRPRMDGYQVELELDHRANHPFMVYESCIEKATAARPTQYLSASPRQKGETRQARFTVMLGRANPLRPGRYPIGYQAAVVLTDHADKSSAAKLEAFAFGRTGAVAAGETGFDRPGFVNRQLSYSKTIFMRKVPRFRHQYDDPAYRKVLDRMDKLGVEVGLHSVTGWRDTAADMKTLLGLFRARYKGRTWIDHEPQTNCEAIAQEGWDPRSEWYSLKALSEAGFRYLWSVQDPPLPRGSLNMLAPAKAGRRKPILYRHSRFRRHDGSDFILFSSTWTYFSRARFFKWFADEKLDALARERGLLIGHVYLENYSEKGTEKGRAFIEPNGAEGFRLRPDADALFVRLRQHMDSGKIMVAGVEEVGDHMLGAMDVEIAYLPGGRALISSPVNYPLNGLTLVAPAPGLKVKVDGRPPIGVASRAGATEFWFHLKPGQRRTLTLKRPSGEPFELMRPTRIQLLR